MISIMEWIVESITGKYLWKSLGCFLGAIMIFPVIEPSRMKNNHKASSQPQMASSVDQFGLGIQVFKIENSKLTATEDKNKQRKAIKQIENPNFSRNIPSATKKPHVLPSLSTEKKLAATNSNEMA
jgi:hypothetical protein